MTRRLQPQGLMGKTFNLKGDELSNNDKVLTAWCFPWIGFTVECTVRHSRASFIAVLIRLCAFFLLPLLVACKRTVAAWMDGWNYSLSIHSPCNVGQQGLTERRLSWRKERLAVWVQRSVLDNRRRGSVRRRNPCRCRAAISRSVCTPTAM